MKYQDLFYFPPTRIREATQRLEELRNHLWGLQTERSYEYELNGNLNFQEILRLQTRAKQSFEEIRRNDITLLVCISSIEIVKDWTDVVPKCIEDKRPIHWDDPEPEDSGLVMAYTQVTAWVDAHLSEPKGIYFLKQHVRQNMLLYTISFLLGILASLATAGLLSLINSLFQGLL